MQKSVANSGFQSDPGEIQLPTASIHSQTGLLITHTDGAYPVENQLIYL